MVNGDDIDHLQAGRMLGDGSHGAQVFGDLSLLDLDGSNIAMELGAFWPPTPNNDQALSPRAASLLPTNWPSMHFPLGRSLLRSPGAQNVAAPSPVRASGPHVPASAQTAEQLPNIDSIFAGSSQGTPPTINPGDSPFDVRDIGALNNGQLVSSGIEDGVDDLSPHSANVPNGTDVERDSSHTSDWPAEFSLDCRKGFSHQLIGLSSELDPYLLRHYQYDTTDTYTGYRLHYRKTVEDATTQPYDHNSANGQSRLPAGDFPIQFVMNDGDLWKEDVEATEGTLSGNSTEKDDLEYVNRLVPLDLGSRFVRL